MFGQRVLIYRMNGPLSLAFLMLILDALIGGKTVLVMTVIHNWIVRRRWLTIFILIGMTIALGIAHFKSSDTNLTWYLDSETGVGTYFSALVFFIVGISVFRRASQSDKTWSWIPLLVVFWGLAIDELNGMHHGLTRIFENSIILDNLEKSGFGIWVIIAIPIVIVFSIWIYYFFSKTISGKGKWVAFVGLGFWLMSLALEFVQSSFFSHSIQCGVEELLEIIGAIIFLSVIAVPRGRRASGRTLRKKSG